MNRGLLVGIAGAGAAALVGVGVVASNRSGSAPQGEALCMRTFAPLVQSMDGGCMTNLEFAALRDRAVLGADGAALTLSLASPSAPGGETTPVSTCAEFDRLSGEGWYSLSTADMRREDFFKRACGALAAMAGATAPSSSHFEDGHASEADIRSIAQSSMFQIGEPESDVAGAAAIARTGEGMWTISLPGRQAILQEIAHADFTGDGAGDILAFASVRAEGGTAQASTLGVMEKRSASGLCSIRAL